jgi:hypothetical protein
MFDIPCLFPPHVYLKFPECEANIFEDNMIKFDIIMKNRIQGS